MRISVRYFLYCTLECEGQRMEHVSPLLSSDEGYIRDQPRSLTWLSMRLEYRMLNYIYSLIV